MKGIKNAGMNESCSEYFFDTYAFFEIINGNIKYLKYQNSSVITTIFNIAELNYNLKKEMPKQLADSITEKYHNCVVEVLLEDIKSAMGFKLKNKGLSIPDCIGYIVAKRLGIKFLTGDEGFRNLENVEFVKK